MMGRSSAKLHIVKGADVYDPRDPDEELTFLFAEEARLKADLAAIHHRLPAVRGRYAAKHGLRLMLPGIDRLRALLGPKP